jgi:hypothetical protein
MTYLRLPYDEASTPTQMATDAQAVNVALHLPHQVSKPAPGTPRAIPEGLAVPAAAAQLAGTFLD